MNSIQNTRATDLGRFASILRDPAEKRALYDKALFQGENWVLVPTLGSIIPNWLLAIPIQPALCFRDWRTQYGKEPDTVLESVAHHLGANTSDLIWFEHGAVRSNTSVGCGTDYAHLHILFHPTFSYESFAMQIRSSSELAWTTLKRSSPYDALPTGASYLATGCSEESMFASEVECLGSQFFRRIICALTRGDKTWDYRKFPYINNIEKTIANFRNLQKAATPAHL